MAEYTKGDIKYISGMLDGVLRTALIETTDDTSFDKKQWAALYGADILYSDLPASDDDVPISDDPSTIMDWDPDREIAVLSPGAELPRDRCGSIVFADGTVISNRVGDWQKFSLPDRLLETVSQLRDLRLNAVREVYDYDSGEPDIVLSA